MKHTLLVLLALTGAGAFAQNTCTTALPVVAGPTYSVNAIDGDLPTTFCTMNNGDPTNGEWYLYTPSGDFTLTVTTDLAQNDGDDTRFHIYAGPCGALVCQGGDDDSGSGYLSIGHCNVHAGQSYHIAFDNAWSNDPFDFRLIEAPMVISPVSFTPSMSATGYPMGVVDMDGDHLDDIVSPSGSSVTIQYQHADGTYNSAAYPTPMAANEPSWSFCAGDIDGNGYTDMMYGGVDGASFVMAGGMDGHTYTVTDFPQYIFCQRTNMVDLDNDGDLDAFSCHDVDANVAFINDGTGALTFHQGGLGPTCGNYGSIWVDYDNDGDQDLFIAKCGCDPVDIFLRNDGGLTFPSVASTYGFEDEQQSWSSAWGDFDNDGDMDGLIGSSSGGYHKLMENTGNGFTNVTAGSGFDLFPGESIEWITYDFDNDGWLDILGGGSLLLNNHDMTFSPLDGIPANGPIGDVDHDGFVDIVNGNQVFINDGNDNHWLTITTVGTTSNADGIGARVEITSALGTQIRDVRSGDGFRYMNSLNSYFGLGADQVVSEITVRWPSGRVNVMHDVPVDTAVVIVEGISEDIAENNGTTLELFPNPAADLLSIRGGDRLGARPARIVDASGKEAWRGVLRNGTVDVSALAKGLYLLRVEGGDVLQARFLKQ